MELVLFVSVAAFLIFPMSAKMGEDLCGGQVCIPGQACVCDRFDDDDICDCVDRE
ncbi:hypothetical protein AAVH_22508, partial [Aphelenchoides avenae]